MKLLILSDVHIEFWRRTGVPREFADLNNIPEVDVVIAAGDIGVGMDGFDWLKRWFPNTRVLYVPGNHEYYGYWMHAVREKMAEESDDHVTVLDPGVVDIDGYRFIGATLWSSAHLQNHPPVADGILEMSIADFRVIKGFSVPEMRYQHFKQRNFITDQLSSGLPLDRTVVITHFVPSQQFIHPKYETSIINPYFTSDSDDLLAYGYKLHVFGHTHERYDELHKGSAVRCVCHPFGYPRENSEPYQWKVVEI